MNGKNTCRNAPDKTKKWIKKENKGMRKTNLRKRIITVAAAGLVVAQAAMPVMAAQTNNNMDKKDDSTEYTEVELKANGHTRFGVFESADAVAAGQVSFEVPLYVTMAATNGTDKMTLPAEGEYYIRNTAADGKTNPIGVIGLRTEDLAGGWNVVENNPQTDKQMTFKLGGYTFTGNTNEFYTAGNWVEKAADLKGVASTFVNPTGGLVGFAGKPGLVKIEDKMTIPMESTIKNETNRTNSKTAGVFKVIYTVVGVDPATNQPKANTYVGDNKATAEVFWQNADH